MEKNILSIADLKNKENTNVGYDESKIINECLYYEVISGKFIGDCKINHFKQCTLKQRESYFECPIYKLSFL